MKEASSSKMLTLVLMKLSFKNILKSVERLCALLFARIDIHNSHLGKLIFIFFLTSSFA